jgi:hypothetical protein
MLGKEVLDKVTSHMTMLIKKKGNKDGGGFVNRDRRSQTQTMPLFKLLFYLMFPRDSTCWIE